MYSPFSDWIEYSVMVVKTKKLLRWGLAFYLAEYTE